MSDQLYQLWAKYEMKPKQYFHIDGPWDKHGIVVEFIRKDKEGYLHLVRGTGKTKRNNQC